MLHDNNQYYYSLSANYPWYLEDNKPTDSIAMTISMEEEYERGYKLGLVITPNLAYTVNKFKDNDTSTYPFLMVHPDSLLSQQELEEQNKQRQLNHAQHQLMITGNLVTQGYIRDFNNDEQAEFYVYQDNLRAFIRGDIVDLPEPPSYLNSYLES